jgi:hypothetical protein
MEPQNASRKSLQRIIYTYSPNQTTHAAILPSIIASFVFVTAVSESRQGHVCTMQSKVVPVL